MSIPVVEIVKLIPRRIWAERDIMGTMHVYAQDEGHERFDFVQISYDYAYTSNAHSHWLANEVVRLLGGNPDEAAVVQK